MTGGGFGGCAVALVKTDSVDAVMETLAGRYSAATGIAPTMFVSRPGQGASILKA
jgi:galactokinase